jgi:hypothetical protein
MVSNEEEQSDEENWVYKNAFAVYRKTWVLSPGNCT